MTTPTLEQYEILREWCIQHNEPNPLGWWGMVHGLKAYQGSGEYESALLDQVLVEIFNQEYDVVHVWTFDEVIEWANTEIAKLLQL